MWSDQLRTGQTTWIGFETLDCLRAYGVPRTSSNSRHLWGAAGRSLRPRTRDTYASQLGEVAEPLKTARWIDMTTTEDVGLHRREPRSRLGLVGETSCPLEPVSRRAEPCWIRQSTTDASEPTPSTSRAPPSSDRSSDPSSTGTMCSASPLSPPKVQRARLGRRHLRASIR